MTRRQILRFFAYGTVGILFVFLLVLYSLYLSAQQSPGFYKETLEVPYETLELRNDAMREKILRLNNDVQKIESPWESQYTTDELNGYFAVEATKPGANLFPHEIRDFRLKISSKQLDVAFRIEQGPVAGILHLTLGVTLPEPNRLTIRIKGAKLGRLPISKETARDLMSTTLEKKGYSVTEGTEGGDPTLNVELALKYGKDKQMTLESLDLSDGSVRFSGLTSKHDESKKD